eukprot:scaffold927_cov310-Pavlova_lutheri.AAC.1
MYHAINCIDGRQQSVCSLISICNFVAAVPPSTAEIALPYQNEKQVVAAVAPPTPEILLPFQNEKQVVAAVAPSTVEILLPFQNEKQVVAAVAPSTAEILLRVLLHQCPCVASYTNCGCLDAGCTLVS